MAPTRLLALLLCAVGWSVPPALGTGGVDSEHGFCELCMYSVHQVQYGALPSCGGSDKDGAFSAVRALVFRQRRYGSVACCECRPGNGWWQHRLLILVAPPSFLPPLLPHPFQCSQVVQSMLAYAHDVMHLIAYGCYKYSAYHGWQTIRPCPSHVLCGRLANIYDAEHRPFCPTDFHYRMAYAGGALRSAANPLMQFAHALARNATTPLQHFPVAALQSQGPSGLRGGVAQPLLADDFAPSPAEQQSRAGVPGRQSAEVDEATRETLGVAKQFPPSGQSDQGLASEVQDLVRAALAEALASEASGEEGGAPGGVSGLVAVRGDGP